MLPVVALVIIVVELFKKLVVYQNDLYTTLTDIENIYK